MKKLFTTVAFVLIMYSAMGVTNDLKMHFELGDPIPFEWCLNDAIKGAMQDVPEGSIIAIQQVKIIYSNWGSSTPDRKEIYDLTVDYLLDQGFRVVAKEYLEKLFDEQQSQQSGLFNEKTIVKDNNFSAVGFYLVVRIIEGGIRIQVINVSTGEYVANFFSEA